MSDTAQATNDPLGIRDPEAALAHELDVIEAQGTRLLASFDSVGRGQRMQAVKKAFLTLAHSTLLRAEEITAQESECAAVPDVTESLFVDMVAVLLAAGIKYGTECGTHGDTMEGRATQYLDTLAETLPLYLDTLPDLAELVAAIDPEAMN